MMGDCLEISSVTSSRNEKETENPVWEFPHSNVYHYGMVHTSGMGIKSHQPASSRVEERAQYN